MKHSMPVGLLDDNREELLGYLRNLERQVREGRMSAFSISWDAHSLSLETSFLPQGLTANHALAALVLSATIAEVEAKLLTALTIRWDGAGMGDINKTVTLQFPLTYIRLELKV